MLFFDIVLLACLAFGDHFVLLRSIVFAMTALSLMPFQMFTRESFSAPFVLVFAVIFYLANHIF
jgi:hypothetical protein